MTTLSISFQQIYFVTYVLLYLNIMKYLDLRSILPVILVYSARPVIFSFSPSISALCCQEFWCILHGLLYFLAIPSMSMLLMIYSLGNLHVVSWGTREAKAPAPQQGGQQEKPKQNAVQNWLERMGLSDNTKATSDYQFSFGNLFR